MSIASRIALASCLAALACGSQDAEAPAGKALGGEPSPERAPNRFENPGFEDGREPWYSLASPSKPVWADFEVTDRLAHTGEHSAVLRLSSADYSRDTRVYGLLRDFRGGPLPAKVAGFYRVEGWQRGADKQYVQVAVSVKGGSGWAEPGVPRQVAWVLDGITEDPFPIRNRRFFFVGAREPTQGEWIPFELDVRDGYREAWGSVPDEYETLRVFFEVRFDGRGEGDPPARADVYFDDLYLGGGPS